MLCILCMAGTKGVDMQLVALQLIEIAAEYAGSFLADLLMALLRGRRVSQPA
jgi:hypothetical protein